MFQRVFIYICVFIGLQVVVESARSNPFKPPSSPVPKVKLDPICEWLASGADPAQKPPKRDIKTPEEQALEDAQALRKAYLKLQAAHPTKLFSGPTHDLQKLAREYWVKAADHFNKKATENPATSEEMRTFYQALVSISQMMAESYLAVYHPIGRARLSSARRDMIVRLGTQFRRIKEPKEFSILNSPSLEQPIKMEFNSARMAFYDGHLVPPKNSTKRDYGAVLEKDLEVDALFWRHEALQMADAMRNMPANGWAHLPDISRNRQQFYLLLIEHISTVMEQEAHALRAIWDPSDEYMKLAVTYGLAKKKSIEHLTLLFDFLSHANRFADPHFVGVD